MPQKLPVNSNFKEKEGVGGRGVNPCSMLTPLALGAGGDWAGVCFALVTGMMYFLHLQPRPRQAAGSLCFGGG